MWRKRGRGARVGERGGRRRGLPAALGLTAAAGAAVNSTNLFLGNFPRKCDQSEFWKPYVQMEWLCEKSMNLGLSWWSSCQDFAFQCRGCGFNPWWCEVAQSCPTLCGRMDCSSPGSSVHGIFQARVLEWVAISFSNPWWGSLKSHMPHRQKTKT